MITCAEVGENLVNDETWPKLENLPLVKHLKSVNLFYS